MRFIDILIPIVTKDFEETVAFYKQISGQEVSLKAAHDGYYLNLVGSFVILSSEDPAALEIPGQVSAIYLIEGIEGYWNLVQPWLQEVIVPLSTVSTGTRFIVKQIDGQVIEYLQLNPQ